MAPWQQLAIAVCRASADMLFVLDADNRFRFAAARDAEDLLSPPEEFLGRRVDEVLPADTAALLNTAIERVRATGATATCDYSLSARWGVRVYAAQLAPCGDDGGILAVVTDVDAERRRQAVRTRLALATAELATSGTVDEGLDIILRAALDITELRSALVASTADGRIDVARSVGLPDEFLAAVAELPLSDPAVVEVLGTASPTSIGDLADRYNLSSVQFGLAGGYAIPIRQGDEAVGSLVLLDHEQPAPRVDLPAAFDQLAVHASALLGRRRAERALAAQHVLLKSVLDAVPDVVFVQDLDGRIVACNEAVSAMVERPESEVIGRTVEQLFEAQAAAVMRRSDELALAGGQPLVVEEQVILGGRPRSFETTLIPWRLPDGSLRGLVGVARDVTARRQSDSLREARLRLHAFTEAHSHEDLLRAIADEAAMLTDSRLAYLQRLNLDGPVISRQVLSSTWPPATDAGRASPPVRLEAVQAGDSLVRNQADLLPASLRGLGAERELVVPIRRRGEVVAILGLCGRAYDYTPAEAELVERFCDLAWDTAVQHEAAEELARREQMFRGVVDNAQVGIFRARAADGRLFLANSTLAEMLGFDSIEQMLRASPAISPYFEPADRAKVLRALQEDGELRRMEVRFRRADGRETWVSHSLRLDRANDVIEGIVADVTDQVLAAQARDRAERALRMRSEVRLAMLSADSEEELLQTVCRTIVEAGGYPFAWAGLADGDQPTVALPVAQAGGRADRLARLAARWDPDALAVGPVAEALRTGRPTVAEDPRADPYYHLFRGAASEEAPPASIALPVVSATMRRAVIGIHTDGLRAPGDAELELLEGLRDDVATGLSVVEAKRQRDQALAESQRVQQELAERLAFQDALHHAVPVPVYSTGLDGRILEANEAFARWFGRPVAQLLGREAEPVLGELHGDAANDGNSAQPRLVRRDGERGPNVMAVYRALAVDTDGRPRGVTTAMVDLTEHEATIAKLTLVRQQLRAVTEDRIVAADAERRRLAVEVHDGYGQVLTAIQYSLAALADQATSGELAAGLEKVRSLVSEAVASTRGLTQRLSPVVLYELGLGAALARLGEETETTHGLRVTVSVRGDENRLDEPTSLAMYRFAGELLHNVVKHAGAGEAIVCLRIAERATRLRVEDDGIGPPRALLDGPLSSQGGLGLFSIAERAEHLGGRLTIRRRATGGADFSVTLPLGGTGATTP